MFCDRCGTPLVVGAQFCTSCGKALAPGPVAPAAPAIASPGQGRVRRHIQLLATLWLVSGILRLMGVFWLRSEEHTSELQSRFDLVCRLLLEKKKEKYEKVILVSL